MTCKRWMGLSPKERIELVGKLVVAIQYSEISFVEACHLLNRAQARGVFDDKKVGYEVNEEVCVV